MPAWSAVLIAVGCTLLGFLLDASGDNTELTGTFSALYVVGCVAAVLAVRMRGLFTTMVLPPLLLFFAVPLAYRQLSGGGSGLKDMLLNLAIPLVNRFPTMMVASVLVWGIAAYRIFVHRKENGRAPSKRDSRRPTGRGAGRETPKRPARPEADPAKPARGKSKPPRPREIADMETDKYEAPLLGRGPSKDVADAPPRVNGRPPREGRPTARAAVARPAATTRAEPEPTRGRGRGGTPPHPQANVRYRDREQGRPRRKPESL